MIGSLIIKKDRKDVIGKIIKYDIFDSSYVIRFFYNNGLRLEEWETSWTSYLLHMNIDDGWEVIRSSPLMDSLFEWEE
jgi:hypothetical protein